MRPDDSAPPALARVPWFKRLSVRVFALTVVAILIFNAVRPSIVQALQSRFDLAPPEGITVVEHEDENGNIIMSCAHSDLEFNCELICFDLVQAGFGSPDFPLDPSTPPLLNLQQELELHQLGFVLTDPKLEVVATSSNRPESAGDRAFLGWDDHDEGSHILHNGEELLGWLIFEPEEEGLGAMGAAGGMAQIEDYLNRSFARQELIAKLVSWGALFLAAVILSFFVSRLVTVRLSRLASAASHDLGIAASSDAPVYDARGGDEIAMLAQSLNSARAESSRLVRELDERDAKRRRFIAQISHDLRTPLTALTACLDRAKLTALGSAENERVREKLLHTLEVAEQDASRVRDLSADLLELARLDLSSEMRVEPVLPGELVARAVTGIRPLADSRGLRIEPKISPVIESIEADGNRLMRVLENLLRNAIRHARSRVTVTVEPTVPEGDALFTVSDDGPGFPLLDGEPVLTRQVDGENDSRDADSAGLGLTIARRIVEGHGGSLIIENGPRSGAVVRFRIPAGPNAPEPLPEDSPEDILDEPMAERA